MSEMRAPIGVPDWTLGWRLKRALSWADIAAGDMADYLGYSKAQISRYLNDKGEPPRDGILQQWALRCGVPYEWLATGTIDLTDPDHQPGQHIPSSGWIGEAAGTLIHFPTRTLVAA